MKKYIVYKLRGRKKVKMCEEIEDIEMMDLDNEKIMETPHILMNSSRSFDSADSGYLSTTPHSFVYTPSTGKSREKITLSTVPRRQYWLRHSDRHKSKNLNSLINASVKNDSGIDCSSTDVDTNGHYSSENIDDKFKEDVSMDRREFRMELRDYRNRARRNQRTVIAVTPASSIQYHQNHRKDNSPLTSPAIPSSSFVACEPIDEDIEDKYVNAPKSSTQFLTTPSKKIMNFTIPTIEITSSIDLTSSPKTSKSSPFKKNLSQSWNKNLSKLKITEHINNPDIKPKRLDFDETNFTKLRNNKRLIKQNFIGYNKIDIVNLLGEQTNHCEVVTKIFNQLNPRDLCAISLVSTIWRRICYSDKLANKRRLQFVNHQRNTKENIKLKSKKFKIEVDQSMRESPRGRCTRGYLVPVHNLFPPKIGRTPSSPPVSPSKIKFHSFVKVRHHHQYLTGILFYFNKFIQ